MALNSNASKSSVAYVGSRGYLIFFPSFDAFLVGSFVCFGVASLNYPGAIDAWGKIHREMDAVTASIFEGSGLGMPDQGLGTFVKMTRHLDIGIGRHLQLQRLQSANLAKS